MRNSLVSLLLMLCFFPILIEALTLPLPTDGSNVVGHVYKVIVNVGQDATDLGQKYGVGYFELQEANPGVDIDDLRPGQSLIIPAEFVLPATSHQGIVINLAELRLYYYVPDKNEVMTFPIGIGRQGSVTPLVRTKIISKTEDPKWVPTADTRRDALEKGITLPDYVEAGPDNPLGNFSMRLGLPSYLIHGTNDPTGVGIRSSAGCIRMYPEDVKALFPDVKIGTPVQIVNEPYKVGVAKNYLLLESHVPLNHKQGQLPKSWKPLVDLVMTKVKEYQFEINWEKTLDVAQAQRGIPKIIGYR